MKKKPKTLGRFLTKKYITTSILLLGLISLFATIAQFFVSGTNDIVKSLCAQTIVRPDYKNIDVSTLKDFGGWIEILDEKNEVIYFKGEVGEKKTHYTQKQLLEMDALQSILSQKVYQIGIISFKQNDRSVKYMATYAPFKATDGREYICISKIPQKSIQGNLRPVFNSFLSPTAVTIFKSLSFLVLPILLIFIFCLRRYSKSVKEHIVAPNTILIDGLRTINEGDYSKKSI